MKGRLGELERSVLEHLWEAGPSDAKAVDGRVGRARGITLHTIQSTLERLHRKRLVTRSKRGRAWVYAPALTRSQWLARSIQELIDAVPGTRADAVLSAFVDVAARASGEQLEELERRIRERRRQEGET